MTQKRAEGGGEGGGDGGLGEEHGRVRDAERLGKGVESRAPGDLPRRNVRDDELHLEQKLHRLVVDDAQEEVVDDERLRTGGHVFVEEELHLHIAR